MAFMRSLVKGAPCFRAALRVLAVARPVIVSYSKHSFTTSSTSATKSTPVESVEVNPKAFGLQPWGLVDPDEFRKCLPTFKQSLVRFSKLNDDVISFQLEQANLTPEDVCDGAALAYRRVASLFSEPQTTHFSSLTHLLKPDIARALDIQMEQYRAYQIVPSISVESIKCKILALYPRPAEFNMKNLLFRVFGFNSFTYKLYALATIIRRSKVMYQLVVSFDNIETIKYHAPASHVSHSTSSDPLSSSSPSASTPSKPASTESLPKSTREAVAEAMANIVSHKHVWLFESDPVHGIDEFANARMRVADIDRMVMPRDDVGDQPDGSSDTHQSE